MRLLRLGFLTGDLEAPRGPRGGGTGALNTSPRTWHCAKASKPDPRPPVPNPGSRGGASPLIASNYIAGIWQCTAYGADQWPVTGLRRLRTLRSKAPTREPCSEVAEPLGGWRTSPPLL